MNEAGRRSRRRCPLIVQRDRSVLLDLHAPGAEACRIRLARFAELVKSPDHLHTYRLTPLSLWNAAATGTGAEEMLDFLDAHAIAKAPKEVRAFVHAMLERAGPRAAREARRRSRARRRPGLPRRRARGARPRPPRRRCDGRRDGRRRRGGARRDQAGAARARSSRSTTSRATSRATGCRSRCARRRSAGEPLRGPRLPARGGARRSTRTARSAAARGVVVLPCGAGKTIVGIEGHRALPDADARSSRRTAPPSRSGSASCSTRPTLARSRSASTPARSRRSGRSRSRPTRSSRTGSGRGGLHALRALPQEQLGPRHLRRGAPAARRRSSASRPSSRRAAGSASPRRSCARTARRTTSSR